MSVYNDMELIDVFAPSSSQHPASLMHVTKSSTGVQNSDMVVMPEVELVKSLLHLVTSSSEHPPQPCRVTAPRSMAIAARVTAALEPGMSTTRATRESMRAGVRS